MKIHPVGVELFHADGRTDRRTDMKKLMDAFRNFANAPNKNPTHCYALSTHCKLRNAFVQKVTATHDI